jgi:hypothetical protein
MTVSCISEKNCGLHHKKKVCPTAGLSLSLIHTHTDTHTNTHTHTMVPLCIVYYESYHENTLPEVVYYKSKARAKE